MDKEEIASLVEAIHDLTHVTLMVHGELDNKSDAIRKMDSFGIPAGRIAAILGMASKDVSSVLAKAHKTKPENAKHE